MTPWAALRPFRQRPLVPVVIDPLLAQKLRPHQVEGVHALSYLCAYRDI